MNCPTFSKHHLAGTFGVVTPWIASGVNPRFLNTQAQLDAWFERNRATEPLAWWFHDHKLGLNLTHPNGAVRWQGVFEYIGDDLPVLRKRGGLELGCYKDMANRSAELMALERRELRQITGRRPLSSTEQEKAFWHDVVLSASQFAVDDVAEEYGLRTQPLFAEYDVQPYNFRDLIAGFAAVGNRINARRAEIAAQLAEEVKAGTSDAAKRILAGGTTPIKADPLLPAGPGNVDVAATNDPARVQRLIEQEAALRESALFQWQQAQGTFAGNVIAFWQQNGPRVEVFRGDNAAGIGAPELFVRVTPREKPKPKVSKWLKFGPLVSIGTGLIPVVGTFVSLAIDHAHKQSVKAFMASINQPGSIFEPQFDPVPYRFKLPGPLAAGLLSGGGEPWLLPNNVERLANADYEFAFDVPQPLTNENPVPPPEVMAAQNVTAPASRAQVLTLAGAGLLLLFLLWPEKKR